jgi:NhaP-type Na+/H+ or K+/H+ antiporter
VQVIAALAVVLIGWALVSARAARFSITVPIVLLVAGAVLAGGSHPRVEIHVAGPAMRHVLEATLGLVLFTDATELRPDEVRQARHLASRLLLIAFPLTVAAGFLAGWWLFPAAGVWPLAVIAAALAASDSSLAAGLVRDERVPGDLRTAIGIESGVNDGLAAPLVVFFLAAAVAADFDHDVGSVLSHTLGELAIALPVGAVIGAGCAWLLKLTRKHDWSTPRSERLAYLAIAALTFTAASGLHGSAPVAAFVAGLAVSAVDPDVPEEQLDLSHDIVLLLSAGVWFVFGSTLPDVLRHLSWATVGYAVLSLTLVRMVPVLLSLIGNDRTPREKLLLGWLGPSGLPSVIFGLLALEQLSGSAAELVATVVGLTVLLSILAHGLSERPIAHRWPAAAQTDGSPRWFRSAGW